MSENGTETPEQATVTNAEHAEDQEGKNDPPAEAEVEKPTSAHRHKAALGPLKEQFEVFGKFGEKNADGKTIKLSQSDKWFKQAKVIDGKNISTTDTGIAFRKISKNSPKLSFADWTKYLDEIAKNKKIDVSEIKQKLVDCGKPGVAGTTAVSKNRATERLTDTSKYGGTHRQRFKVGDPKTSVSSKK